MISWWVVLDVEARLFLEGTGAGKKSGSSSEERTIISGSGFGKYLLALVGFFPAWVERG